MNLEIDYLWSHKCPKKWDQYTLIALVITIIVLLILAGVTIATLTGDNGLLHKSTSAKQANEESTICENIKLAYGEYQIAKHTVTDETAEKIIEDNLKLIYGDNIQKVKVKNEKVTVDITVKDELKTYMYKATTGVACQYKAPFDYGEYTKENIPVGKDITLGGENFRVFYNKDGLIKAMPFYNLVTVTADGTVKQGPEVEGTSTEILSRFSTTCYWTHREPEIDMNNPANNIQQYINVYKTTLNKLGAKGLEVRTVKINELNTATGITGDMRNPGQSGKFWTGSAAYWTNGYVYSVKDNGDVEEGANGNNNEKRCATNY